jgi:hypothetical protein
MLENVNFVRELWINLFGIGKPLKNGFNLSNGGEIIKLSKGNVTLTFDKVIRTKNINKECKRGSSIREERLDADIS